MKYNGKFSKRLISRQFRWKYLVLPVSKSKQTTDRTNVAVFERARPVSLTRFHSIYRNHSSMGRYDVRNIVTFRRSLNCTTIDICCYVSCMYVLCCFYAIVCYMCCCCCHCCCSVIWVQCIAAAVPATQASLYDCIRSQAIFFHVFRLIKLFELSSPSCISTHTASFYHLLPTTNDSRCIQPPHCNVHSISISLERFTTL